MTQGIEAADLSGCPYSSLLELSVFVVDHPARIQPLDVIKHRAGSPPTHCTLRHINVADSINYVYTTTFSSADALKHVECYTVLFRASKISNMYLKWCGMNERLVDEISMTGKWPLMKMSDTLVKSCSGIPKSTEGTPVVSVRFDAFVNN